MASKAGKKKELAGHTGASSKSPSAASKVVIFNEKWRFPIWPEWNDADINAEKWDTGKPGKEKPGKGQISPGFDDPEGKIRLPASLKVHSWKRPQDFLGKEVPVIVKNETSFDLVSANEHIFCCELMRWIVSEIYVVWRIYNDNSLNSETPTLVWKPWEHIYALCKANKECIPLYNKFGKYVLKLYWMGCWRKITVDDTMPFNEDDNLLLPATACQNELWPMLLSKGIIKLASTSIHENGKREMEEFTVLQTLTGWIPEVIPLQPGYLVKAWGFLKETVPEFKLPEKKAPELAITQDDTKPEESKDLELKSEISSMNKLPDITEKAETGNGKENTEQKKLGKKKKGGEKEKSMPQSSEKRAKAQDVQDLTEKPPVPIQPEMVVYAGCIPLNLFEEDIFLLTRMADSSEKMRQYGLSHIHSHPVLITRTRSCPLVVPPEPPPLPPWKLFRQKKQIVVTSEPQEPVVEELEEHVEISSLFFKYKLDVITIPTDTHFPQSTLKKGFHSMSHLTSVTETDENESDSNGDMNQNERYSNAEDYSQESISLQQNADVLSREEYDSTSSGTKQTSERADTDTRSQTGTKSKDETVSEKISVSNETWISLEDFCVCFQNLYVFHKPHTYAYNYQMTSFKSTDEELFYYLLVDSLTPIEILVSFSALVHWYFIEDTEQERSTGVLRVEYFSWKSVTPGELVLKMHTSATKATVVNLPVGRHILVFTVSCAIGHHIHLCTMVPCLFGEEDAVMPALQKESARFTEQATAILKAVGNVINNFSSEDELPEALKELEVAYCPPGLHGTKMAKENIKVFNNAFWYLIKSVLDKKDLYRYKFAFRSLTLDFNDTDLSGDDTVFSGNYRTSSSLDVTCASTTSESSEEQSLSSSENRTSTSEEEAAIVKIQAFWRGTYIRKILKSREPGTKENTDVEEILKNLWAVFELNFEQCAVTLLREMFKRNRDSVKKFPCYEDEWCKMYFTDYAVSYPDQPPNTWFLVFREIFIVPEDMLILTKVFTTIPSCRLHVLDNDTQEEMPHAFFKVAPHVYPKNKKGYTFVAEAQSGDRPVAAGKWKLRFISSHSPLPFLSRGDVNNDFSTKQFKEYYIPNDEFLLFRYFVKVSAPHAATLHVQTSNSDVFIKLQVLDNEKEITSVIGKGNAVIPVFNFCRNQPLRCSQSKSLQSTQSSTRKESETGQLKKGSYDSAKDSKTSFKSNLAQEGPAISISIDGSFISENFESSVGSPQQSYRYSIEALVLHDSWPLTESESLFVQELKEMQKNEIRVKRIPNIPKATRRSKEKVFEKTESEKLQRERGSLESQPGDSKTPYWILRIVSEQKEANFLTVKKDTRRVDEIRAMKQAWEAEEPGRSVKAFQERVRFINKCAMRDSEEPTARAETADLTPSSGETETKGKQEPQTSIDSRLKPQQKKWKLIDLSPYTRKTKSESVLRNESIIQQQQIDIEEKINHFRQLRMLTLEQRQKEENDRVLLKQNILKMYENLQASLDETRGRVYSIREAYRNQLLEAERRKQEELAAQEEALRAERKKQKNKKK